MRSSNKKIHHDKRQQILRQTDKKSSYLDFIFCRYIEYQVHKEISRTFSVTYYAYQRKQKGFGQPTKIERAIEKVDRQQWHNEGGAIGATAPGGTFLGGRHFRSSVS